MELFLVGAAAMLLAFVGGGLVLGAIFFPRKSKIEAAAATIAAEAAAQDEVAASVRNLEEQADRMERAQAAILENQREAAAATLRTAQTLERMAGGLEVLERATLLALGQRSA